MLRARQGNVTQNAFLSVKYRNSSCICLSFLSLYYQCPDPDVEKVHILFTQLEVLILVKKKKKKRAGDGKSTNSTSLLR